MSHVTVSGDGGPRQMVSHVTVSGDGGPRETVSHVTVYFLGSLAILNCFWRLGGSSLVASGNFSGLCEDRVV